MTVNTTNLEGYTVFSSVSLAGSGATLLATDIVASTLSVPTLQISTLSLTGNTSAATITSLAIGAGSGAALGPTHYFTSEASLGLYRSAASRIGVSYGQFNVADGTALLPSVGMRSEASLGLYRSAASQLAVSYGQLNVTDGTALLPGIGMRSETSLGLFRSGTSVLALSYGTFDTSTGGLKFKTLQGSTYTVASSVTTLTLPDGTFYFAVTSTTSAEFGFRSGNTIHKFLNDANG